MELMATFEVAPTEVFDGEETGYTVTVYGPEGARVTRTECYTRTSAEAAGRALVRDRITAGGFIRELDRASVERIEDALRDAANAIRGYDNPEKIALIELAHYIQHGPAED